MQVLQTWLCCWGAKALNLRSVHQLFIGILIIQNKMYLRTFNMSFLQGHIEIQKVFSHFVSAVQRFYNVYYIYYIQHICVNFLPSNENHPFNQWCLLLCSFNLPTHPPVITSSFCDDIEVVRSSRLPPRSDSQRDHHWHQGAKKCEGAKHGGSLLIF